MNPFKFIQEKIKMRLMVNIIAQGLAFVVGRFLSPTLADSPETQAMIQTGAHALAGLVAVVAHHYNTDGTPQSVAFKADDK